MTVETYDELCCNCESMFRMIPDTRFMQPSFQGLSIELLHAKGLKGFTLV